MPSKGARVPDSSPIRFAVNGQEREVSAHPMARLIDVLREQLKLTGTKEGCGEGECGACSVLVDGMLVNSCLIPVVQVAGRDLQTIEGLEGAASLHAVQVAFIERGGAQCGICTPGMLLAAAVLLRDNDDPDEPAIREALAGNLCRCTGYTRIVESVVEASRLVREKRTP
jgi:carbon-monoxide dehydrogenase small subunit